MKIYQGLAYGFQNVVLWSIQKQSDSVVVEQCEPRAIPKPLVFEYILGCDRFILFTFLDRLGTRIRVIIGSNFVQIGWGR